MASNNEIWPEFEVTKLDAARRQLETAIFLLFEQADAVSIHTLAHAAFGILKDVAERRKADRVLQAADEIGISTFNKNGKRVFSNGFNKAGNFFKHGDNDPAGILSNVPEEQNEALIFIAVELYRDLGCLITPEIKSFHLWWQCIHFHSIDDVSDSFVSWLNENSSNLHTENRSELLNMGKNLLQSLKSP